MEFLVGKNSFEGAIPESGFQAMRSMTVLFVQANRFAGTLPNAAVAGLRTLLADRNDFEGKMSYTHRGHCVAVICLSFH
eukprot:1109665-Amphidinium_carterae.1